MSADLTTAAIDVRSFPFAAIQAVWTGSPTGTLSIDGSIDNVQNPSQVTNWFPTGTSVTSPTGSADSTLINLQGVGFAWLRLSYTYSSGTGSLSVLMFAKAGGGS
jgi:hypothetical protein